MFWVAALSACVSGLTAASEPGAVCSGCHAGIGTIAPIAMALELASVTAAVPM